MKAIERYINLTNEVISLYEAYQVINYRIQGLEYIKRLQRDVQTFNPKDIEGELTDDYPDVTTLQRRLDFVEMKLDGYLIDCPISDDDWLGDGGVRCKHLVEKLGQKQGMEYVIRLHSILESLNCDSHVIVEMITRLRAMDANPQNKGKRERIIKEAELKEYFTLIFKGGGNSSTKVDYFTEYLLPDLKIERNAKDFARIALLIYDSKALLPAKRPNTFDGWYRTFCELVGCEYNANYKPSKLEIDDAFKKKFNYLP